MNRIYQGRVTKVEIFNGKNAEPQLLDNWEEKLLVTSKVAAATEGGWQHHELFQDPVNSILENTRINKSPEPTRCTTEFTKQRC